MTAEQADAIIELLEAFPDKEDRLLDIFISFIRGEITSTEYERKTRRVCVDQIMKYILTIKQGGKADYANLINAYFDVARYQTDTIDASIEWGVDRVVLQCMLTRLPVPKTPDERLCLTVPQEVVKRREV